MFCPYKNSYLQLENAMDPRIINKVMRRAMRKKQIDPHDELPPAQRMDSMQPSLYAPYVDITRARLGFDRIGLRIINRDITSQDNLIKLQAIHTLLDQVQISESAMFLISLNVVHKVISLMTDSDPIVREKVALILTQLGNYYQGRKRIIEHSASIDRLMFMFLRDRKEIRYAAALCTKTLTRDRCACEVIMKNDKIVENLLRSMKSDHMGIIILHMNSLKNLFEWDPIKPLKANAFQVMMSLMKYSNYRVVQAALDCLTQLCKHSVGQKLADKHDLTHILRPYLACKDSEVIISAVGLMTYTTLTTQAKWRVKDFSDDLTKRLVEFCVSSNAPVLKLRAMQVLINICDCPDIKAHVQKYFDTKIKAIRVKTHEQWDGTSESTTFGLETGHNYRTMCIEKLETIKNEYGDSSKAMNVHSYLRQVLRTKAHLLKVLRKTPYDKDHVRSESTIPTTMTSKIFT